MCPASAAAQIRLASVTVAPNRSSLWSTGSPAAIPIRTRSSGPVARRRPCGEPVLDGREQSQRTRHVVEGGHDPVAGVLDLASARRHEGSSDDQVVFREQHHVGRLADRLEERRRTLQVREQDGPERVRRRRRCSTGSLILPEEPQDVVLRDRDDLVGDQTMGLPVHRGQRLGRGCLGDAERLPRSGSNQ